MGYTVIFDGKRECLICHQIKRLDQFGSYHYTTKQGKLGKRYSGRCRQCEMERSRAKTRKTSRQWSHNRRHPPIPSGPDMKVCVRCQSEKPRCEFYSNKRTKDGLQYDCKVCRIRSVTDYTKSNIAIRRQWARRAQLKRYGLTPDEFDAIVTAQNGRCKTCDEPLAKPHIDHDHETGRVRGALCLKCNMALGLIKDSVGTLRGMLDYLEVGHV